MKATRDRAASLRSRCLHALEEDPDTEVGKVHELAGCPGVWVFYVYVTNGQDNVKTRAVTRTNAIIVSPGTIEICGPDEKEIGTMLSEPVL